MSKTESPRTEIPRPEMPRAEALFGVPLSDAFAAGIREHLVRLEAWMKELSALEDAMVARARATTQHLSQLTRDSIDYVAQLSAEWRKLAIEVTRKASDVVVPKA